METLVSRDNLTRASNLAKYIQSAKDESTALTGDWAAPYWEGVGYFVKQEHAPRGSLKRDAIPVTAWLDESFIDFAKAHVVERHMVNPGQSRDGHTKRLQALRLLEEALLSLRADASPLSIDPAVLEEATNLARQRLFAGGAHKVGANLERLAGRLVRAGVLPANCETWVNPVKQPKNVSIAVDAESDRARKKKLPDHDALYALAELFTRDFDPSDDRYQKDIVTTSAVALLMCAPSRGQEVFRLPENLVFESTDKFGKDRLGLRLHASKGFGAYVKWVWSGMVPVAERAIERIRAITEEGRRLARHLENPETKHRFYRHENCPDVPDDQPLTKQQVCHALGFSTNNTMSSLNSNGLNRANGSYTLHTLWNDFVLPRHRELHPHFPYVSAADAALGEKGGLKFSEALFCTRLHQFTVRHATSPVSLSMPDLTYLNFDLCGGKARPSIFERYGYLDEKGRPLRLNSHQVRHLINTEAQRVGLSDEQIAHWSGRKRVDQNTVYDHRTVEERVEQTRDVVEAVQAAVGLPTANDGGSYSVGQWVVTVVRKPPALADVDGVQPHLSGLKTLYGQCHHDWSFAPCESFVKCLDCSEHACIKGEKDAKAKLEQLRALEASVGNEVDRAEAAAEDDVDAQDWLDVQRRYRAKVQELIVLLESESVPDGAVIRTADGQNPTHIHRALRGLAAKALELGTGSKPAMEQLLSSLESGLARNNVPLLGARGATN